MGLYRTPQSVHHPHKNHDEHRQCNPGAGIHFAVLLGSDNLFSLGASRRASSSIAALLHRYLMLVCILVYALSFIRLRMKICRASIRRMLAFFNPHARAPLRTKQTVSPLAGVKSLF